MDSHLVASYDTQVDAEDLFLPGSSQKTDIRRLEKLTGTLSSGWLITIHLANPSITQHWRIQMVGGGVESVRGLEHTHTLFVRKFC
jgi:hypothetical protein